MGDNRISIEASSTAIALHEIAHVRQSLMAGGLVFSSNGELTNAGIQMKSNTTAAKYALMSLMEIEAYKIQYSFDNTFPGVTTGLTGIDVYSVGDIKDSSGNYVYGFINDYANYARRMIANPSKRFNTILR